MTARRDDVLDVVIVGGGAAGLSAALVLGRARRRVAVVDAGEPRNAPAAHMHGFLSRDGLPPSELLAAGRDEVRRYGVEVIRGRVVAASRDLVVTLDDGRELRARRLLLTTGARDRLPDVEGAAERWGRDLLHCPYCHGWEVRDKPIGVLGTIPGGSVEHALLVRQWSDDVVFFSHRLEPTARERCRLAARGVVVVDGVIRRLVVEDDRLAAVELADGRLVGRSALFIRPDNVPPSPSLAAGLGCDVDERGFVVVDSSGRTRNASVWAAGNAVDARLPVISAAGAAATAAMAINADLVREETDRAVEDRRRRRRPVSPV